MAKKKKNGRKDQLTGPQLARLKSLLKTAPKWSRAKKPSREQLRASTFAVQGLPTRLVAGRPIDTTGTVKLGEKSLTGKRAKQLTKKVTARSIPRGYTTYKVGEQVEGLGRGFAYKKVRDKKGRIRTVPRFRERKSKIRARARATTSLLSAFGAPSVKDIKRKVGRPKGSYKYGIPISQYKKIQARREDVADFYAEQRNMRLARRGLSPEQIKALQTIRTAEQIDKPIPKSVADDEVLFRKFLAERTVSPNTQRILDNIRRVQNKGRIDNIEQQRRLMERKLVEKRTNLMKAHENMINVDFDVTGVSRDNILLAPNTFLENPANNILRPGRLNILQTREAGNQLRF